MDNKYEILRSIWLKFIETPQEYVEERQKLLDEFLMRFIHLRVTEKESNYEDFGDWSMVGSLIVHHFMSDIHQICQSIQKSSEYNMKTDISDDDTEIIDKLHEYLLKGRGWKLLFLLSNIGMQGVTCTKELINLVISLFPVCLQIQAYSLNSNDFCDEKKEFINIEELFSLKKTKSTKIHYVYEKNIIRFQRHHQNKAKIVKTNHLRSKFSHNNNSCSNSDEDNISNSSYTPIEKVHYSLFSRKFEHLLNFDKNGDGIDTLSFDHSSEYLQSISLPNFCIYMIEILFQIALIARQTSLLNSLQQILNFSLESLQFLELKQFQLKSWSHFDIINLERALLRLIAVSSHTEIETKTSSYSLKELQILISIAKHKILSIIDLKDEEKKIVDLMIISLLEIIMTVLLWILKLTEIPINNENLITVIQEISVFSDDENSSLISDLISCIELRKNEIVCNITNKVIGIIKNIIISLKRLRFSYYIKLHKPLLYSSCIEDLDHHVDILELQPVHKVINKTPPCCVSIMCNLLLNIRTSSKSDEINLKAIEALQKCGLCCCMNFNSILNSLLKMLPDSSQIIQVGIIRLIEKTILKQFGLTVFNKNIKCEICINRILCVNSHCEGKSENIQYSNIQECSFFLYYYYLIENSSLTLLIGSSLLDMVIVGHEKLKKELFNHVIFPAFHYLSDKTETSINNNVALEYCVVSLSSLLQSSKITELFLKNEGLKYLYSLFSYSSLQNVSLQTLKCLILTYYDKNNKLNPVNILQEYSDNTVESSLLIFESLLLKTTNQMCLLHFSCKLFNADFKSDILKNIYLEDQSSNLECNQNFLCNLWFTCRDLVCRIPFYRKYLIKSSNINIILNFLEIILKNLNACDNTTGIVKKTVMTLLHTVLVVCIDLLSYENISSMMNDKFYYILEKSLKEYFPEDILNLQQIFETLFQCMIHACPNERNFDRLNYEKFLHYEQEYHLPSESSEEIDIADEGYDADIEIEENLSKNSASTQTKRSLICNKEICRIILKFFDYYNKIYSESNEKWQSLILFYVQQFVILCQAEFENRIILHKEGILKIIFNNLESILVSSLPECRELQGYIMELFFLVGQYSITEEELQLFFNFFKVSLAPVDTLLNGLNRLIKSLPKAPSEYIIFPTKNISNVSENYDDDSFNLLQVEDHHPLKIRLSLLDNSETELCSWKCATALFPLCDDSIWHPFENGFSVTLWLSIGSPLVSKDYSHEVSERWKDKGSFISMLSSEETDCQMKRVGTLHVLSIGTELMFETWIDPQCGSLIFRITKCASDGSYYCLAETSCHKLIEPHKWQHITINYKQIKKEETIADIIVIVDGYKVSKFFLHYSNQSEKFQHSYVLFGHNGKKFYSSSYYIGNLMFFQDNVLTREHSYYLSQLGPDIRNITDCHLESQLKFFPQSLVPLMLESDISVEALTCMKIPSLVILQEKLLATYSPKKPNILSTYPNIFNTVVSLLASFTGISPPFKVGTDDQRPSQQQPVDKVIKFNIKNVHTMKSVLHSIETMGGIKSILFLFGRVVECSSEEKSHADAMELLFYLLQKDAKIYTTFQEINGMLLVKQVLESEKCITSYLMLQVFLNACISGTILQIDSSNGAAFVDSNSKSVIINPLMFKEMIICWKIWEKIDTEVLKTLFSILQTLVRDKHSYQKYNISQMLSVSTEDVLFSILEDKFSSNENVLLSKEIAVAIPWLIQKFFNTFKLSLLKKIFNCLLLLHQASSTYICHAPSSFYFLFTQNERGLIKSLENTSDDSSYEEINEGIERIDLQKPLDEASNSSQDNLLQSKSNLSKENKDSDYLRINYEILYLGNEMPDNISSESFPNECDLDKNHSNLTKDDTVSEADKIVTREQLQNKNHNVDNINCESVPEVEDEIVLDNSMLSPHSYKFFLSEEEWEIISLYSNDSKDQGFANIFIGDENTESEEESYSQPTLRDDVIFSLINIIRETIITAPDSIINDVISTIKPEALIVFALNPCSLVASSCIMTLDAYLQRSSDEVIENFLKTKSFHLLANQLHQFPATAELLNACLTFIVGHPSKLEERSSNFGLPFELSPVQLMACIPLLALLPNTAHNLTLCHNTLVRLQQLLIQVPNGIKTLLENGLMESLAKLISIIVHSTSNKQDRKPNEELIYEDIYRIIYILVIELMSISGTHTFQKFQDILWLFSSLEAFSYNSCVSCICSEIYRNCQCSVFSAALEHIIVYAYGYKKDMFMANKDIVHSDSILDLILSLPEMRNPYSHHRYFQDSSLPNISEINITNDSRKMSIRRALLQKIDFDKSKKLTFNELVDRFQQILIRSMDFFIYKNVKSWSQKEKEFAQDLVHLSIQGMKVILDRNKGSHRSLWFNIIHSIKEIIKTQFSRLLIALLSSEQSTELKYSVISLLNQEEKCMEIINYILQSSPQNSSRIAISIHDILFNQLNDFDEIKREEILSFANTLEKCKLKIPSRHEEEKLIENTKKSLTEEYNQAYKKWLASKQEYEKQVLHRLDFLVKQVSENAMDATQIIVNAQNIERKKFITKIKDSLTQKLLAQHKWSSLIEQLSHERAAWHFRQSYPQNWELDPTEGPLRIRRRLRRFHLNIKARFLLPEYRQKLDCRQLNPPLSYLHQSKYEANESNILKDKVHADEQICYNCCCYLVTPSKETLGEILIGEKSVYFVAENFLFQSVDADILCLAWLIKDITEILPRRYELQDSALEIFLTSGITYLIAFKSVNIREEFYLHIKKCQHFTPHTVTSLSTLTNQWRMHSLTNFEYLMQLNKLAGRSCNDLMQYPVFPFIIANYSSSDLNLEDPSIFRNLSRPVAIQNKAREQHYINAYNYLKAECETMSNIDSSLPISGPYHYGSHYSNSGTVLHFLVRLPPFTEVFLAYQDDNFDIPDRTFHSLDSSWRLSSGDSTSDVKELIPEFYFLPEFLLNSEGFDFGIRQTGERVHHVALPPWCHDDPRLFILIHRQALESDFVTGQLQNWIDLIFGYKQTGKAAVEAINVFHPVTYYGHDITKITDPVKRCGLQTMIKTVGQTPRQLFFAPHPMVELSISLGNEQPSLQTVLPNIQNLKWGSYVGSPSSLEPLLVWRCNCSSPICKLVPLMTNDVFGLTTRSCLLLNHRKSKAAGLTSNTYVMSTALVSWGYGDGIIRMTLQKDRPTIPLFTEFNDPISVCGSVPNCQLLFVGHLSGIIDVHDLTFDSVRLKVERSTFVQLYGHSGKIMAICICKSYSIVVTSSMDCTMIIWDLNRLQYVQSIFDHKNPVKLLTISDTLGDIASVSNSDLGSYLKVHTINAKLVGTVYTPIPITAICYSNAKEGISVNVIVTGFLDGTIKLWNSWNLNLASVITTGNLQYPIISLTYSEDNQHLYAANKQGIVTMWKNPIKGIKESRFLTLK